MKAFTIISGIFVCLASLSSCSDEGIPSLSEQNSSPNSRSVSSSDVILQWTVEEQKIDGFGVAQAGWADYLYAHRKRNEVMDILFGQDGLKLSILRGEVFPHYWENTADKDFNLDADINLSLDDPFFDTDFSADGNEAAEAIAQRNGQLWISQQAKQTYQVDKLIFSTWTPPAYMKSNGSTSKGYLKSSYYQAYADYLSAFCSAYASKGLPVYAISPANEPEYAATWNSCLWLPGTTTLGPFIVNNLGPTLRNTNPTTKIIFGENGQWTGILGFIMGSQNYVRDILNLNSRITNFPIIAAGHGYIDPVTKKDPGIAPFEKAESKNIPVWLTEISDPSTSYDPTMTDALRWAKVFHRYLCEANAGAIVWWAGALPDRSTTEGMIYISKNRTDYEVPKRCEVFGNFSRYIPVNSTRISAQYNPDLGYMISGYKSGKSFTVVAINPADTETTVNLTLSNAQTSGSLQGYVTDATRKWEAATPIQPIGNSYTLVLPARSVVSYTGMVQ
ncbi:MAG: glycoside hydrolase [Bacteroides sp.]|uniref:glycoside hydrolase n=1 Tax=Bacteroides sp. TaxID=29523 RepID=UPI002FC75C6A